MLEGTVEARTAGGSLLQTLTLVKTLDVGNMAHLQQVGAAQVEHELRE